MAPDQGLMRAWLDYSRRVVTGAAHARLCAALGGSRKAPGVFPATRWPGYVGEDYRAGGLLWINIVHRDMVERWDATKASELAQATEDWSEGRIGDEEYLTANRTGYRSALDSNGWHVGRDVRRLTSALGWTLSDIAYANAARCQVVPDGAHADTQNRLVMFCQGWIPIRELAETLRPGLIYVTPLGLMPTLVNLPGDPLVVGIGQRGKRSSYGWQPAPGQDRWAEIALEYRRRRAP